MMQRRLRGRPGDADRAPPAGRRGAGLPELLSPAEAAQALGVSEADVMAVLESGELKGKKIGATLAHLARRADQPTWRQ